MDSIADLDGTGCTHFLGKQVHRAKAALCTLLRDDCFARVPIDGICDGAGVEWNQCDLPAI